MVQVYSLDRKPFSFQATISLVALTKKKFYVVKDASGNLSKGKVADYTADAKGKIAIVKRGGLTFADKQKIRPSRWMLLA